MDSSTSSTRQLEKKETTTTITTTTMSSTDVTFVDYQDESQLEDVTRLVVQDLSEPYSIFTYRYFLSRFPDLCILAVDSVTGEAVGCVVGKIDTEPVVVPPEQQQQQQQEEEEEEQDQDDGNETTAQQEEEKNDGDEDSSASNSKATTTTKDDENEASETPGGTANTTDDKIQVEHNNTDTDDDHNDDNDQDDEYEIRTGYIGMLAVSSSHRRKGIGKSLVRQVLQRMLHTYKCNSVTLETEVTNTSALKLYQHDFGFIREELLVRYYLNWNDAYRLRLWL